MSYEISGTDLSDFIGRDDIINIEKNGCNFSYKTQPVNENLYIIEGYYQLQNDLAISGRGDSDLLEVQFNLSEKSIFYHDRSKKEHTTPALSGNIAFLAAEDNEAKIFFQKQSSYHTFDIHLPLSLLDDYEGESKVIDNFLEKIHKGISTNFIPKNLRITPAIYNSIQDIKMCTYEGLTRKIYLKSKAYEIIALLYESSENQKENFTLSSTDQKRIHDAAEIIRHNISSPLTIIELAHQLGINQTKLKTGFKALFGNTVFGYLQDIRMHQAKRYLLDTQMSVQEIGMLMGYQNTSNFSTAFKRVHGYTPMKLRKK